MTIKEYEAAITKGEGPPEDLSPLLRALWFERRGDWDSAHRTTQDVEGTEAAWVHAYLHRREGDLGNARYWYHRAGRRESTEAFEAEWRAIAEHLLRSAV
jgi:hypothetical protein